MRFGAKAAAQQAALAPDPEVIRALAGLLTETGLTEIEYAVGDHRIRVARGPVGKAAAPVNGHAAAPAAEPATSDAPPAPATNGNLNGKAHPGALTSPIVGVAYLSPQPGAAPFVRPGETVAEGQTILIIEAMKVMNEIRAPRAGRIAQIFIADAEPVEYGAPLLLIE